ncbi:MAG: DUF427 domain-containing protein [Gemmatimonadaceae bacterium]
MARAVWNGAVVAEGENVVVVDGYTYFRRDDVNWSLLTPSDHRSVCGWKGEANYFTIHVNGASNPAAAWEYADPKPAAIAVKGRVGFWRGVGIDASARAPAGTAL